MAWSEYNEQVDAVIDSTELVTDAVEQYQGTWQFPWRNNNAHEMAGLALRVSMDELAEGSMYATLDLARSDAGLESSALARKIGLGLLEVVTGYVPVISTARDAYEAISGYDLISGEELSLSERSLAILGVATLGAGKGIKAAIKTVETVGDAVRASGRVNHLAHGLKGAVGGAGKIADNARKHGISLDAGPMATKVDKVILETLQGKGDLTSKMKLTADEALEAGAKWVGNGYKELGKSGKGVFRSADGRRQFRIDNGSLLGTHNPNVPHVHFEEVMPDGRKFKTNNHVPFQD